MLRGEGSTGTTRFYRHSQAECRVAGVQTQEHKIANRYLQDRRWLTLGPLGSQSAGNRQAEAEVARLQ